ncbi:CrcB family protein [Phreatobacter sp. AB_2022a]|uniref:CrcB family protein n=1 Tax=Phreatobacter sp. AB_2022a TaxID=3003134 RepID=UPI0022873552|nr:CrcB family protein [Phreatobacter sp. AB_2022a]MCZ0732697.1 CrcB family protein [Phreatobacter sp. AB_2022a]
MAGGGPGLKVCAAVGCGAALGSLLRFLAGTVAVATPHLGPLAGTAVVNLLGCFVIAAFAGLTGPGGRLPVGLVGRQFVMAGFCGGLTTFSSLSLETFLLFLETGSVSAFAYLAGVIAGSLGAAWLGYACAEMINRQPG